jgi:NAD(P)-dependent dehydrogenase (short-subunit alcohol dehydrogenase family)
MSGSLGLEGRFALVTAGTAGCGGDWVQRLRDEGMDVALLDVDPGDRPTCDRAIAGAIQTRADRVDALVIGHDVRLEGSIEETPEASFRELLERNLTTAFRIGRACFATMRTHGGGSMIFVASDAGIRADHDTAAYSVTSAGLIAVAELFGAEGAAHGIRANALCPRPGVDVAPVVAWLASDESRHVNGATLRVDDAAGAAMLVDTRT